MIMNNFQTFDNLYGNLAQATYPGNPLELPKYNNSKTVKTRNFSQDTPYDGRVIPGGQNLPNDGVVYLQPDPTLRSVPRTTDLTLSQMNGGYQSIPHTTVGHYQKGLLTDEPAGFNAYFLTDTPTLSSQTKNAYFAVRGSDGGFDIRDQSNWNDWVDNNLPFTIKDANVPQAILATNAMRAKGLIFLCPNFVLVV